MSEKFAPTVVVDGVTVTPPGWMWILALALNGNEWAIKTLEDPSFDLKHKYRTFIEERRREEKLQRFERMGDTARYQARYEWLRENLQHIRFDGLTCDTSDVGLDGAIDMMIIADLKGEPRVEPIAIPNVPSAALKEVIETALIWAYCPDSGGYVDGYSVEDTCEELTMAVEKLVGIPADGAERTVVEVLEMAAKQLKKHISE